MTTYILHSLVWSLAGFLFGWMLGWLGRDLHELKETVMPEQTRHPWRIRLPVQRMVGIVIAVLAVITMVTSVVSAHRLEQATRCQARFNATYGTALTQRLQAADRERNAQRRLIVTIARAQTAPKDKADAMTRTALNQYLQALDAADQRRQNNPLPTDLQCP